MFDNSISYAHEKHISEGMPKYVFRLWAKLCANILQLLCKTYSQPAVVRIGEKKD